ncbi:MAG: GTPase Era [Gammaproteobacteria bacterium]|nr:GTPase Era [Gammaproteobacteria bacterium]
MASLDDTQRCGIYAIVGRPNVGKSTLLNRFVGQKISITSRKPQTTRYKVTGIVQHGTAQIIFADTPGWQRQPTSRLHKMMNQQINNATFDIDGVLMVIDAAGWRDDDAAAADSLAEFSGKKFLVINKIDRLPTREALLPLIDKLAQMYSFEEVFPVAALTGANIPTVLDALAKCAPVRAYLYDPSQVTDQSVRFIAAELIREKIARQLGAELPYATHVEIERFEERDEIVHIDAAIWVEKPSQKAIVIGNQGQRIKQIGTAARMDIEKMLERRVYLKTWVKVRGKWTEDPTALEIFKPHE